MTRQDAAQLADSLMQAWFTNDLCRMVELVLDAQDDLQRVLGEKSASLLLDAVTYALYACGEKASWELVGCCVDRHAKWGINASLEYLRHNQSNLDGFIERLKKGDFDSGLDEDEQRLLWSICLLAASASQSVEGVKNVTGGADDPNAG